MDRGRLIAIALLIAGSFAAGMQWAGGDLFGDTPQPEPAPPGAVERIASLEAELDLARTRNNVDQASLDMVRGEMAGYKEQIAALEEELRFYRSLMSPGDIAQGLSLRPLELVQRDNPRRFAFRIVAQQGARKHSTLKGDLRAEVYGRNGEEGVSYPLAALSEDVEDELISLRFRYFQSIEGVLTLPDGFQPEGLRVSATARSPRRMEASGDYPWQVQERFTHVGK